MQNNLKIIGLVVTALVAGWFLGSRFSNTSKTAEDQHTHSDTKQSNAGPAEVWTCSMHPQIRQDGPGDCPLCGMDLTVLNTDKNSDPLVLEMTAAAVQLANVQTTIVGNSSIQDASIPAFRLAGKVQADERLASSQVAHLPGRIEQLYVTYTGASVKKGQVIADMYSAELITAQRELLEALKLKDLNPALLEAARNKLRYWKINEALIQKIEAQGSIQEVFPIYADATGVVTQLRVAVGDHLMQGEPLFDLVNLNRVWVLFDAYESDLADIALGDRIEFTTPAIPGQQFKARITFIDPVVNAQTRVVTLRTEVNNSNGRLKPEMLVYGSLNKKAKSSGNLRIPKSAVLWTGKRSVVYEKLPGREVPTFRYRAIEIGAALGDHYEVLAGLEAGTEIVTQGNFTIDAAAQLHNQASMMNEAVALKATAEQKTQLPDYKNQTGQAFKKQLEVLLEAYLSVKDALVATDSTAAAQKAANFLQVLSATSSPKLGSEAVTYWQTQQKALQAHGALLAAALSIENQRQQFEFLSDAMITTIKVFGVTKDTYYVQHCPMAFEDQGADWISDVPEIRNPYFGDLMLKCGLVEETINGE